MRKALRKFIYNLPYIKGLYKKVLEYEKNSIFPVAHYYSPIVSVDDIQERSKEIWKQVSVDGVEKINLNTEEQVALLKNFQQYYQQLPFTKEKEEDKRYYFENPWFSYTDAILLYSMMRHFKPKRIIEIGSGFSSAVMLDTRERFFQSDLHLTFIEPYPERLFSLISEKDKETSSVITGNVQDVELSVFEQLGENDFLFVDSSHVSKTGSDVNFIFFEILPRLKNGVIIHFHDVFYPFEYPKKWVLQGRNWNEDYLLRAFLMYNDKYKIQAFADYLHTHHKYVFDAMPLCFKDKGASIWLKKQ